MILCHAGALFAAACGPSAVRTGPPFSQVCAVDNPCPGITQEKLRVCGECDPATRYFRRSICSLGEKLRKAFNSCVDARAGVEISGAMVFGSRVQACVEQRLENEPKVLEAFVAVAREHAAKEEEQRAWRRHCERRWAEHRRHALGGAAAAFPAGSGVGTILLKMHPPDAAVWIDGRRRRGVQHRGWLRFQDLDVGEHDLELRVFDMSSLITTVNVVADQEKKYTLVLKPLPGCTDDADCRGHDSGPRCFKEDDVNRCSCASNADCTARRPICRPVWQKAPRKICDTGAAGQWCRVDGHCRSGRCTKPNAVSLWGLCQ